MPAKPPLLADGALLVGSSSPEVTKFDCSMESSSWIGISYSVLTFVFLEFLTALSAPEFFLKTSLACSIVSALLFEFVRSLFPVSNSFISMVIL